MDELLLLCEDSDEFEGLQETKRQRLETELAAAAPPVADLTAALGTPWKEVELAAVATEEATAAEAEAEAATVTKFAGVATEANVMEHGPPSTAAPLEQNATLRANMMHSSWGAMPCEPCQHHEHSEPKAWPRSTPAVPAGVRKLPICHSKTRTDASVMVDALSGIRIDPQSRRLSCDQVKELAMAHKFYRLDQLRRGLASKVDELSGQWFTTAVLVEKADPKMAKNGEPFSRWGLSDLVVDGTEREATMTLFLFGGAHGENWKSLVGEVFIIINATQVPPKDDSDTRVSYKVELPDQVQRIGRATDYKMCSVSGCKMWLGCDNGSGHCKYHAMAAIRKTVGKRGRRACASNRPYCGGGSLSDGSWNGPRALPLTSGYSKCSLVPEILKLRGLVSGRRE